VSKANVWRSLERETGIEPATNSLEGCDSTTELLPHSAARCLTASPLRRRVSLPYCLAALARQANHSLPTMPSPLRSLPTEARARDPIRERRWVAREGLEPSKPLGRQIYSLLRLTASLPRQLCVLNADFERSPRDAPADGAGEGIRTPDLLITNQLLYQPELRQPDQKRNYSTSRARRATPATCEQVRNPCQLAVPFNLRRCRTASNSTTPVATDTFRL
jgi:hypothetical protein